MPPKRQRPKQAPASKNGSGAEARGKRRRTVVRHQQDNYVSPTEDSDNDTQHKVMPTSKPQRGQQPRGNTELLSFDDAAAQAGSSDEEEEEVILGEEDEDEDEEEGDEFDMDAMDDDVGEEEEEEEGDEAEEEDAGDAVAANDNDPRKTKESKLASAIGKILAGDLGAKDATRPILAKQKHLEQAINNEKLEDKARRVITAEKKKKIEVGHVVPDHTTTDYEKKLRKVATRGVVKLFNAIRVAQRTAEEVKSDGVLKNRDAAPVISKNTFLDMIKPKTASDDATAAAVTNTTAKPAAGAAAAGAKNMAVSAAAGSGPSWAKEDYMMKAPKHWDEEDDEEEADVV
ncbi:hypothetical protein HDU88_008469 [Geranomyces variabilis]|nr:hypothetical protein HDU88_008469 [Geranomyces variabilis]